MNILVIGGGGREHAIIKKLRENPEVTKLYACPGNGGIAKDAECVAIGATDIPALVDFAVEKGIDFCVVAPDDPLALGCVDAMEEKGIPCFGPNKDAAVIEGSKVFAKNLMQKYGIPTARYEVFSDSVAALAYIRAQNEFPTVIKADGLALGKGVIIAETMAQAEEAVKSIMEDKMFGDSGNRVVVEEFLTGPEVSVLSFTDGRTIVPMVSSMDHKRALDGDKGLNTGGMGTVAPNPYYTADVARQCMETIFLPTVRAMNAEGRTFKGCLYFGLMLTKKGPRVIEYNCRFGDPETQVVLPLLKTDLFTVMRAVHDGRLAEVPVEFAGGAAACVVVASGGYPQAYPKGLPISLGDAESRADVTVYHAGTTLRDGQLVTSGGRVLGVTATGEDLPAALEKAYAAVREVSFDGAFYRRDIGARALAALGK
ncbi:MAG TPA: phosphoribosylamine--glycine ligase [Candidatus Fimenecus excrementigallinarum]|uniref:Phosphoribosylamine--glycine ligase n=1 Tax=Candidatus Fimenecus excrementigallinarum TaxID=2840816 RepID=A0A9D1LDT0_9FIRM|nr:phosphoribosylamine--glycine ligase [Candidatus Fimenecus excrementigallinarum]